jgi:hypothetical protein
MSFDGESLQGIILGLSLNTHCVRGSAEQHAPIKPSSFESAPSISVTFLPGHLSSTYHMPICFYYEMEWSEIMVSHRTDPNHEDLTMKFSLSSLLRVQHMC